MTSPGGTNEIRIVIRGDNEIRRGLNDADRDMRSWQTQQVSGFRGWARRLALTGRDAGRDLGQNLSEGARNGTDNLTRDVTQNIRTLHVRLEREGERAGEALGEGVADGAQGSNLDGQLQDVGADGGGGLKAGLVAGAAAAVAALAAVGLAAGAALVKGVGQAIEAEKNHDKLAAQLGLNERESARAGKLSGKVYADAYGESLTDVDEAIRHVSTNISDMRKTSNADVESMTKKALDLASAYEMDVGETTRAVGKLIKTGLVKDATEGFDLITAGMRGGVDEAGDLLDTVSEYSTQFRDLGISGPKAMGMLSQALKAGARDADTAADAIKEFAIRSKDGSESSKEAFEELGLNSSKMFKTFAKGGPDADKAMKQVIDRLKAVKNPLDQNAIAVALFGTKAEDLQDALFAIDPTTAVKSLGKVEGAAKQLGDTLGDNAATKIESFKRRLSQGLTEAGAGVLKFFEDISNTEGSKEFMKTFRDDIMPVLKQFGGWISGTLVPMVKDGLSRWLGQGAEGMRSLGKTVKENRPELEKLVSTGKAIVEAFFRIATSEFATSGLKFAIQSVGVFVAVMAKIGPAIRFAITNGVNLATVFILSFKRILDGATWAFGWVPGLGPKLKNAQRNFDTFARDAINSLNGIRNAANGVKSPTIKPRVDYGSANAAERWLANLARSRTSRVYVQTYGRESGSGDGTGRRGGYAHGGIIGARAGDIVGAFTGGIHGGMRWVGEHGPELVELPYGSKVNPAGQSARMAAQGGGVSEILLRVDLTGADSMLLEWIRKTARVQGGGNVQLAFGKAGR